MDSLIPDRRCRSFSSEISPPSRDAVPAMQPSRQARMDLAGFFNLVLYPIFLQVSYIGMVFVNNIDLAKEIQTGGSSFTFQNLIRLAFLALSLVVGAWGWWHREKVRLLLSSLPGLFILALAGWHFVTVPMALDPTKAFVSAFSFVAIVMITTAMLAEFGFRKFVLATLFGALLYVLVSIGLYLVAPEMATFKEVMNRIVTVERFGGLSHPNILGKYAVLMLILTIGCIADGYINWKWVVPILVLAAGVLVASKSRTPIIAGTAAALMIMLPLLRMRGTYLAIAAGCLIGILGYMTIESSLGFDFVLEKIISKGTKTGSADEVTTVTGRTDIWQYSLARSVERPIFGWGAASTPIVMEDMSGHSHNIILHPILAIGFPGGMMVIMLILLNFVTAIRLNSAVVRGCLIFLVVIGLVESPLLGSFPDALTCIWLATTLLPVYLVLERGDNKRHLQSETENLRPATTA